MRKAVFRKTPGVQTASADDEFEASGFEDAMTESVESFDWFSPTNSVVGAEDNGSSIDLWPEDRPPKTFVL